MQLSTFNSQFSIPRPIGIVDSGVGGLSVWKEVVKELPHESTLYIADSQNIPYGTKSPQEIYSLAKRLVIFLLQRNVKLIIVACNTITVSSLDRLRNDYPMIPIIGTVPVVKTAAEKTRNMRIGILSTVRTAESSYQKQLIQKFAQKCTVINIGTDKLVPLIEDGQTYGKEVNHILRDVLIPFIQNDVDTLALGCTHYPFMAMEIQHILGEQVVLLEPSSAIARHARRVLASNNQLVEAEQAQHAFSTSGSVETFSTVAKKLLGTTIQVERVNL